ncbi:Sip1-related alpha-galactosidase [Gemmatimonadota bacterium]
MRIIFFLMLCCVLCFSVVCTSAARSANGARIEQDKLLLDGNVLLEGLPGGKVSITYGDSSGVLLSFATDSSGAGIQSWRGTKLTGARHLLAIYRMKPWWTRPGWPKTENQVPPETEALLWRRSDGRLGLILPLIADGWRFSLEGDSTGLVVTADNNMATGQPGKKLAGIWLATGDDPYELLESSFRAVVRETGAGSMLVDKPHAGWADWLGWASWYAFWQEISEEKFLSALESLDSAGIRPGYVLLDDGWQDATPDRNLIRSFEPDSTKFPHGLRWLVSRSKEHYGVKQFMVWHTLEGYWRGIDRTSESMSIFPQFRSHGKSNRPMPDRYRNHLSGEWNVPRPEAAEAFFRAYHGYLAGQGVDGVKVDNQSDISYMTYGLGPLSEVTRQYVRGLEHSAVEQFGPASVLNCMSMVTDCIYNYRQTTIMRTSTDFFPDSASSWGPHLVLNAYNSLVWGNIIRPDWDMFMSGHEWAAYHAASRAISGGPVYLSDPPGEHDPGLVARVALNDSRVLRPAGSARPTADILFRDPQTEPVLLKVFNYNPAGGLILAAFHANYVSDDSIADELAVDMIPDIEPVKEYAVLETDSRLPVIRKVGEKWTVALDKGGFKVYAVAPVRTGVAALGRAGMFNMGGAVQACGWENEKSCAVKLACGGEILFYCRNEPEWVEETGRGRVGHTYDPATHLLSVVLPGDNPRDLSLHF